ncbi:MAG: energy transducer TonB [Bryobacteraceae bacterium]|jgi:TonB family protein
MRLLPFTAVIVLTGSLSAADPELVSLAMPDSQVMAGVNVAQVMLSPLGQYLLAQTGQAPAAGLEKLMETAGFDPRRDLREFLVAASGKPGSSQVIILTRGTFDVPKILEAAAADGETVETYNGVPIVTISKQPSVAFPDSTLAILGDAPDVRAAIDRKSAPTAISSALAVQVDQLSSTEDGWFVTMVPLSQLPPQAPGGAGAGANPLAMLSNVQQLSLGVRFGANVVANLQAVSKTNQDAAALAALLKSFAGAGDLFLPKDVYTPAAALLQSLNVTVDGNVTKVSLSVPESQIEQMIQASHANATHQASGADAPVRARPPGRAAELPPSAGASPQRLRVGSAVQKAKLVQHVEPVYPPLAMQARISGVVHLNAVIGKDGTVQNLTVASGHPLLVPPAMEAVKQWVYAPTLLNGQAVEVVTQVEVEFRLSY